MSRPSEPVDTVSMSIACMFLPSRMIEPLPNCRSICDSAASRAFDLSMDGPSTRRSAALISRAPYGRDSEGTEGAASAAGRCQIDSGATVHDLFFVRNMFSSGKQVLAPFHRSLVPFEFDSGLFYQMSRFLPFPAFFALIR